MASGISEREPRYRDRSTFWRVAPRRRHAALLSVSTWVLACSPTFMCSPDTGDWVLLLDVSTEARQHRQLQQRLHDLSLLQEQQTKSLWQQVIADVFLNLDQFLHDVLMDASLLADVCAALRISSWSASKAAPIASLGAFQSGSCACTRRASRQR
jgi:hypothetical protein